MSTRLGVRPFGWNRDALYTCSAAHTLIGKPVPTLPGRALIIQHRIDVTGIGLDRQRLEPARDLVGRLPALLDESLAFAERGLVVPITPRGAACETTERQVALDGGELE